MGIYLYAGGLRDADSAATKEAVKVSEWLREYQITGVVPDVDNDRELCFWAGWMMGGKAETATCLNERLEMAIKAAEFIEAQK